MSRWSEAPKDYRNHLDFETALTNMMQEIDIDLYGLAAKKVKSLSAEIAESLDIYYEDFFDDMYEHILMELDDNDNGAIPPMLKGFAKRWPDISQRWAETKDDWGVPGGSNRFYRGLTKMGGQAASKSLSNAKAIPGVKRASSKSASGKKKQVGPFDEYIKSLSAQGTAARFFGPVAVRYALSHSGAATEPVKVWMGNKGNPMEGKLNPNEIRHIAKSIVMKNGRRGWSSAVPTKVVATATIEAFRSLKNIDNRSEWSIVDYILKRVDPGNDKQWVKINGRVGWNKSRRPVRAMVAPLVQFYINQKLPKVVHAAIERSRNAR